MFRRVLIANRGEIAVRIARTLRELDVEVAAVFTDVDRESRHLGFADAAVPLGADPRAYLDVERVVAAAVHAGADALHPGYGFLSENAALARACEERGVTFIGPPARAIAEMGNKQRARALMAAAGVPLVPGGPASSLAEARETARRVGYPVLVKAAEGGGGKGMRRVETEAELAAALERTASEAGAAFGSQEVYVEKALDRPRHVEIQILGDRAGHLVHLYERDCSIQRRHQKVLEETPCPALGAETLAAMCDVARAGARAIGYYSAGTFEFLLDAEGRFYFLEMNTRLQVEHPITELVTGVDLVREMVRVAAGEEIAAETPERRGVAIEARIYAEDPARGFLPSPGRIGALVEPSGPGVRLDSGVEPGSPVGADYDPLLAKLAVWGADRESARRRLGRALSEYAVTGVETNVAFLRALVESDAFRRGEYDTSFIGAHPELLAPAPLERRDATDLAVALGALSLSDAEPRTQRDAARSLSPWVLADRARLR